MDNLHLEMAIFLLGKYESPITLYELLKFLEYPYRPVRAAAIKILATLEKVEYVQFLSEK
jgi:HEAT repeat protein